MQSVAVLIFLEERFGVEIVDLSPLRFVNMNVRITQ